MAYIAPPPYILESLSIEKERGPFFWSTVKKRFDKKTRENVDLAITMFRNHAPLKEIAKAIGVPRPSIRRWLTQELYDEYVLPRVKPESCTVVIRQLRDAGWTWAEVAEDLGFKDARQALMWAKYRGVHNNGTRQVKRRQPLTHPHKQTIAELVLSARMDGKSWFQVDKLTGIPRSYEWAKVNGLDPIVFKPRKKKGESNERP